MPKGVTQSFNLTKHAVQPRQPPKPSFPKWMRPGDWAPEPRNLKIPGLSLFRLRYCQELVPSFRDRSILAAPISSFRFPAILHRYENDPPPPGLWMTVTASALTVNGQAAKATIRERARRRVRSAFHQALREKGYDHRGKPLADSGHADGRKGEEGAGTRQGLEGTLEVVIYQDPPLHAPWRELVRQADLVVGGLMKACRIGTQAPGVRRPVLTPAVTMSFAPTSNSPEKGRSQGRSMTNRKRAIAN